MNTLTVSNYFLGMGFENEKKKNHYYVVQEDSKNQEGCVFCQDFLLRITLYVSKKNPLSSSLSLKSWLIFQTNLFYSMVCVIILQSNRQKILKLSFILPSPLYTKSVYYEVLLMI